MRSKLSWREKLEKDQQPNLVEIPPKMARFGKGKMLIPTPFAGGRTGAANSEGETSYRQ
jgi:hypothetical protein